MDRKQLMQGSISLGPSARVIIVDVAWLILLYCFYRQASFTDKLNLSVEGQVGCLEAHTQRYMHPPRP